MNRTSFVRTSAALVGAVAASAAMTILASGASPLFFEDDPVWVERDSQDASRITPLDVSLFVDLSYNVLRGAPPARPGRAGDLNTIDEVPDSSWFTNRLGRRALTPEDVATGPDTSDGPAAGIWTITSSKSDGVTPGFTVKDAEGQRWFLKFDPPGYRGMATGTEVAVTKLMWALGYNVPENHIAYMRREQLVVAEGAKVTPPGARQRLMRADDIDRLLARASRESDGSYRVVASKALAGKPIGRIRFFGTRPDDPNDVVPHEDRRELRAYGVFAAWLNHVDAKAINSLDTLVTLDGRSFVRHHLIDFGSAVGSGGVGPADYWAGDQYLVEAHTAVKQMLGFGFASPGAGTAGFYEAPSIGRFPEHNAAFDPDRWKPRVPNQAFLHARADDKFWAAEKLMALTTPMLQAAVTAGEFGDPDSEAFLVRALAERRDAIGRAYLTAINPISEPALDESGILTFRNAAVDADFARAPHGYHAAWYTLDNATGATRAIGESSSGTTRLDAPVGLAGRDVLLIKVELSAIGSARSSWETPVNAYFRHRDGGWQLIGFERLPN